MHTRQHAFSLVELSIVIVIIGLIIGGVVAGRSLIRASEINAIGADVARVKQAVGMFREQYRYAPGDMANATVVWGEIAPGCTDALATGQATCNGNGDGKIGLLTGSMNVPATAYEVLRAWQHLSNAGLIDGKFTGGPSVAGQPVSGRIGVNMPAVAMTNASMQLLVFSTIAVGSPQLFQMDVTNEYLLYGGLRPDGVGVAGYAGVPLVTPSEAESLDRKIDDGHPGSGRMYSLKGSTSLNPNCADSTDKDAARYNVTHTDIACSMLFSMDPGQQR